ncbi:MAG: family 78 glycoside hydrolase catalytic domain, partial [Deltaproteobacteria bacterium]|nr:family 78 glycoside hydrolase catalytic domain [Deltaproteobacteria bacterium]
MNYDKFWNIIFLSFIACVLFSCQKQTDSSSLHIENMKCEYLDNPLGIDMLSPRLSWQIKTEGRRGEKQTAYRIMVASSLEKLHNEKPDLWDTDNVNSNQLTHIEYQGKPLQSRMQCYWKVMVWDENGQPSPWSKPAFWSMGLLEKSDWSAQWIGSPEAGTAPYYRHSFNLEAVPENALVYLASLGYFELYINGKKVGKEVLAPAVSNFSKRTYYKTYDVASYLKKGKNSIGVWMGTGWYSHNLPGIKHHSPVVRMQLEIPNKDKQRIITDLSWKTKASARSRIGEWSWGKFGGELVDARLIDEQWWNSERSINGWQAVVNVETADVPCTTQKCRNNIQLDEIAPVSLVQLDDTTVVVDFGTNLTGMLKMKFHNLDAGKKITIHYADLDGRRYALIEGLDYMPKKEDLAAIPVETEVPEVGSFSCSNDLYNRIHKMVRWTYRALNLGGQTVDCPHRERLGYGDGQTAIDVGCYNFDASTLYLKWSENWLDEQEEDGLVTVVAPSPHGPKKGPGGGPAWGAMIIVAPWKTYLF